MEEAEAALVAAGAAADAAGDEAAAAAAGEEAAAAGAAEPEGAGVVSSCEALASPALTHSLTPPLYWVMAPYAAVIKDAFPDAEASAKPQSPQASEKYSQFNKFNIGSSGTRRCLTELGEQGGSTATSRRRRRSTGGESGLCGHALRLASSCGCLSICGALCG